MTAEIIQLRDYRRKEEKLKEQAAEILSQIDTGGSKAFQKISAGLNEALEVARQNPDGLVYESSIGFVAPPEDCA